MQLSLQVANSLHFCCKPLGTTHESYATNKSDEVSPNHLLQEQSVLWGWKTFQIVLYAQGNAKFWYIACARGEKKDVIMNWHGTVDERTWNDKFEGDVLDETLNIFLYQQMTRPGWQHTSHVAVGPMERFSPSET